MKATLKLVESHLSDPTSAWSLENFASFFWGKNPAMTKMTKHVELLNYEE